MLVLCWLGLPPCPPRVAFQLFSQDTGNPSASGVAEAWQVLTKGLDDGDAGHRKTAIAAIGTIGARKEAVEMVERGLQDKDAAVRVTAARTLGEMGAKEAIPTLRAALEDTPEVSFVAAKALWDLGDVESSRDIFQAVIAGERKDQPGKLHAALKDAKKRLAPARLALMGVNETSGAVLGPGSIAVIAVEEAFKETRKDPNAAGRSIAAEVLSKDSDPYSLALLEWALGDANWAVRLAAAKGLGDCGNERTILKLQPLLSDQRHAVRYMTAASIVKLSLKKPEPAGE